MILQALTQRYETLLERGEISPPGWDTAFKVSFGLELSPEGDLLQLIPYQHQAQRGEGKNAKFVTIPHRLMQVPAHVKRSSGVAANFLCDTSSYLLGADAKGKPARALECFAAARALHETLLADAGSDAARAVLAFFRRWQPAEAAAHPLLAPHWKEITGAANLIFCFGMQPVTADPALRQAWQRHYDSGSPDAETAQCLVTGKVGPVAKLHPAIKGVRDAQTMGASLVSFNAPAFESYGHSQGMNAPVSEYAAFAYTTALNGLLADSAHCRVIGDTTVVCWSEHGEPEYQDFCMMSLFGPDAIDTNLSAMLQKLADGAPCEWKGFALREDEHFYVLGLAPNAARLSVRFFLRDSFGHLMRNLYRHYQDTAIIRPAYDKFESIPLWKLLGETVNQNARSKSASKQMSGDVLRAVLEGGRYPASLLYGAQLRIRAEREITRGRAAIIKAYYIRASHPDCPKEVLQMELNPSCTNIPYTLGRLFSVCEQVQQAALPEPNATIRDKYFNAASATPARIFPILLSLSLNHLRVLRRSRPGAAVVLERKIGELCEIIGDNYPARLSLPQTGAFQLGYFHENQARYQKKETVKENV